jgi:hypothetical protein
MEEMKRATVCGADVTIMLLFLSFLIDIPLSTKASGPSYQYVYTIPQTRSIGVDLGTVTQL